MADTCTIFSWMYKERWKGAVIFSILFERESHERHDNGVNTIAIFDGNVIQKIK